MSCQISIVIPCYNEQDVLKETHRRVSSVCEKQGYAWTIIYVDDGSTDDTWKIIEQLQTECENNVRAVRLSRNFGHEKALYAGLSEAPGDRILILDADLQDPPELLPEMMVLMDRGYSAVYGQRVARTGESVIKKISSSLFYRLFNLLSDVTVPHNTGDFRLVDRKVLNAYLSLPEANRFNRLLFSWVGFSQVAFPYQRSPRFAGASKYNYNKLIRLAVDGITSFSIRPLKVALYLSFCAICFAALVGAWAFYNWYTGSSISGWASLIISLLLLGGCQLFVLGVIGEYLGRLFVESKRRPPYIVERRLVNSDECDTGLSRRDSDSDT